MRNESTGIAAKRVDTNQSVSYRTRIYESYGKNFQDANDRFDERAARRWGRAYKHYFRGWLPEHDKSGIVDLACGGGKLLHFFKNRGYTNLIGVDISPDQVELSMQVTPEVRREDVLEFLQSKHSAFDLITGLDIVEHFHKDEVLQFLDSCHGALKPAGRLILQTPNADSPLCNVHRYGDFTHEVAFNSNSLSRLMSLTGFQNIESREMGPVPVGYSVSSAFRWFVWQSIRGMLVAWNLAETGTAGSGVLSRVFLISGIKARERLA